MSSVAGHLVSLLACILRKKTKVTHGPAYIQKQRRQSNTAALQRTACDVLKRSFSVF